MSGAVVVDAATLRAAVSFEDLIEPISRALRESSEGRAQNGLITLFPAATREAGDVYVKAGAIPGRDVYIVKVSPWFAANVSAGRPQGGFVAAFDSRTGETLALLEDEHYLSDIRTAATGALAARTLAPVEVRTAAILGAGVQAYWQARALRWERSFKQLTIWARDPAKAATLASRLAEALEDVRIETSASAEDAVHGADVIVTTTSAREPIVRGEWLRPGQHITAIGADDATKCELDAVVLRRARVFVDDRAMAVAQGNVRGHIAAGAYAADDLAGELGEVLGGRIPGRLTDDDITVATLVGIGAQDLAATETAIAALRSAGRLGRTSRRATIRSRLKESSE